MPRLTLMPALPALAPVVALAVALAGPANPARAQARPPTLPLHDVSITYRLAGALQDAVPGGLPDTVRIQWDAAGRRLRLAPEGRNQVLLLDLATPRAELLDTGLHGVVALPVRAEDVAPISMADARLTRRGASVVAGIPCTDYDVAERRGRGTVCLSADGVPLRGAGTVDGRSGSFVALAVTPGPVPAEAFAVPPGFMRLAIPRLAR